MRNPFKILKDKFIPKTRSPAVVKLMDEIDAQVKLIEENQKTMGNDVLITTTSSTGTDIVWKDLPGTILPYNGMFVTTSNDFTYDPFQQFTTKQLETELVKRKTAQVQEIFEQDLKTILEE